MPQPSEKPVPALLSGPFLLSVVLLVLFAAGLGPVTRLLRVEWKKQATPLRSPLAKLDKDRLGPYRFIGAQTLEDAVVNTLGTEDYIDWFVEDTTYAQTSDPRRYGDLFVTYYTGQPDPVPHVPDICMKGAGYHAEHESNTSVRVRLAEGDTEVPVRLVAFIKSGIFDADKINVLYTFHCNGRFYATREAVRTAIQNPLDKHAYYSKVEVRFGWANAHPRYPSADDSVAATQKLFSHVLPLLLANHWPDWAAVEQDAGAPSSSDAS